MIVSGNFSRVLFSLLNFFFLEDGICTLSQNVSMELPFYSVYWGADKSLARPGLQQDRDVSCDQVFFPARQGAEGNSRNSDRNISLFPSWSG